MDEQEREREVERQAQHEAEAGQMGGAAEAHAGAGAYPVAVPIAALMGSVRWGATVAGIAIAFAVTMVLIALGAGFGLRMGLAGFGGGLAYWIVGAGAIGAFLGVMLAVKSARVKSISTAVLHGLVIWAFFMLLDVSGVFLFGMSRLYMVMPVETQLQAVGLDLTMATGWWFFFGYAIVLAASILGAFAGLTAEDAEGAERR